MFVGSGTPQQLYSVIPKQNGEELPEQQIFSLLSLVFSTCHQRLIEVRAQRLIEVWDQGVG